uniref:60S ribosomal protein L29 n=1 Tax=Geospiza parvula TaxID=87175 RepID=A0A8U8BGW2_GEOPR
SGNSRKWHRNGIKKPKTHRYESLKGVRAQNHCGVQFFYLPDMQLGYF